MMKIFMMLSDQCQYVPCDMLLYILGQLKGAYWQGDMISTVEQEISRGPICAVFTVES